MTARFYQPAAPLDSPSVVEHSNRSSGEPDAMQVMFSDGSWAWVEDPSDARSLAAAFTEAADRLDALSAARIGRAA